MDFEEVKARVERLQAEFDEIDATDQEVQTALKRSDGQFEGRPMAKLIAAAAHLGAIEESDLSELGGAEAKEWARQLRADLLDILDAAAADYAEAEELEDYGMVEKFLDWTDAVAGRSWRKQSKKHRAARQKLARVVHELERMDLNDRFERLVRFFEYMEFNILMDDLRGVDEPFVGRYLRRLQAALEEMDEHPTWPAHDATEMVGAIDDRLEQMEH